MGIKEALIKHSFTCMLAQLFGGTMILFPALILTSVFNEAAYLVIGAIYSVFHSILWVPVIALQKEEIEKVEKL